MARVESQALGGYYKTPRHITPLIAKLFDVTLNGPTHDSPRCIFVDPCAGTGEAIIDLALATCGPVDANLGGLRFNIYTVELEKDRAEACINALNSVHYYLSRCLHGDAFKVTWNNELTGTVLANFLYLNPPYDWDSEYKRLEHRFLERFTNILRPTDGALAFVVPHHALSASAEFIATHYTNVHCFRFPDADFGAFKQVVLVATRRGSAAAFPQASLVSQINDWAADASSLPVLGSNRGPVIRVVVPHTQPRSLHQWKLQDLDKTAILKAYKPFKYGKVGSLNLLHGYGFDTAMSDYFQKRFPVVLPPRPVHVAIALASGIMNGERIEPDDPQSGLPPLMPKGTFLKEYQTIETKTDKDGNITSLTKIQKPELRVTALDMDTWQYIDLAQGSEPAGATDVHDFNIADLLVHYGKSLVRLMMNQCPPLHDPADYTQAITLPPVANKTPYHAQVNCLLGLLKMLFTDDPHFVGQNPFILGEVGTGKTLMSLVLCWALSPRHYGETSSQLAAMGISGGRIKPVSRVLVMCPPHLIANWSDEIKDVLPGAGIVVLERISDVDRAAALTPPLGDKPGAGLLFMLVSREMAKLGHAWEPGLTKGYCPTCGNEVPFTDKYIVSNRARCTHAPIIANNDLARMTLQFAGLASVFEGMYMDVHPFLSAVQNRATIKAGKKTCQMASHDAAAYEEARWKAVACPATKHVDNTPIARMVQVMLERAAAHIKQKESHTAKLLYDHVLSLLMTLAHPDRDSLVALTATATYRSMAHDTASSYGTGNDVREIALKMLATMDDRDLRDMTASALRTMKLPNTKDLWDTFDTNMGYLDNMRDGNVAPGRYGSLSGTYRITAIDGKIHYRQSYDGSWCAIGSEAAASLAFNNLMEWADFSHGETCGSPLYTAVPKPRRFPLADYIAQRYPNFSDILFLDEAHEYNSDGSAQERAAHRLSSLGKVVIPLTGTSNNGYASSLFANMWAFSRRFRQEFGRDEVMTFVSRYGYRKVRVEPDGKPYIPKDYGAMSNRSDTGVGLLMRQIGQAPGVLPLFTLRHMLPMSVLIHKDDLDADLPPKVEIPCEIDPLEGGTGIMAQADALRDKLITTVMDDLRSKSGMAGKLWGQLAQLPTYLDRPHEDTGNADHPPSGRRYEIRYPESVGAGLVAAAKPLPRNILTPKETYLVSTVKRELDEDRPVLVLVENTRSGLANRLQWLVQEHVGVEAVYLDSSKVSAGKRQEWINTHVIRKRKRVLIVNPTAIMTGLNNLVYFPTDIWYQNPRCSPIIYTQTNGRVHRPGQRSDEVRIYFPYYRDTIQALHLTLLGHKIASVRQVDGLDISSALIAAGAGGDSDAVQALSVGRALYEMMVNDMRVHDSYFRHKAAANGHDTNGAFNGDPHPSDTIKTDSFLTQTIQLTLFGG